MTSANLPPSVGRSSTKACRPAHLLLLFATRAPLSVDEAAAALDACMHRRDALGLGGVYAISEAHVVQLIEGPRAAVHAFLADTRADPQWSTIEVLAETTLLLRWFPSGHTSCASSVAIWRAPTAPHSMPWPSGDRDRAAALLAEALIGA
jgi:hypothetical protein